MTIEELEKKWRLQGLPEFFSYDREADKQECVQDCLSAGFVGCLLLWEKQPVIVNLQECTIEELTGILNQTYIYFMDLI